MKHLSHFALLILSFACFFFSSCAEKEKNAAPPNLLAKDKMTAVLVDIHLAEASVDAKGIRQPQIDLVLASKYEDLFKKHKVTYDQFKSSYNYYLIHSEQLDEIYTEVVARLTTLEGRMQSKQPKRNRPLILKDSLPHQP